VVGASRLVLATGVAGILDKDVVVARVTAANRARCLDLAGKPGANGRGGMRSTVEAGLAAISDGVTTHIASADADIFEVLASKVGTTIAPEDL